ncbi:MAG: lamin tail domain-containing protein [Candidatus Nanoarchaeia archaeon]
MRLNIIVLPLLLINCIYAVSFSEVMPNPYGPEPAGEWIEIYSDSPVVLENWSVVDAAKKAYLFSLNFDDYAILSCNKSTFETNFPNVSVPIFNLNCSGLGWLNNGEETIYLKDNFGKIVDSLYWYSTEENKSLSNCFGNFVNTAPTPGEPNICNLTKDVVLEVFLSSKVILNATYTSLFKISILNKTNCSIKDNITANYSILDENGTLIKQDTFTKEVGCSGYSNTGVWRPDKSGNFTLQGQIIESTSENYNLNNDFALAKIEVLDSPVQILYFSNSSFGDLKFVLAYLNLDEAILELLNWTNSSIKFLVYSASNKAILREFDNSILDSTDGCKSVFAVPVQASVGYYYLALPYFIAPNCNSYYLPGNYSLGIRAFKLINDTCPSTCTRNTCYDFDKFEIFISGKNYNLCVKEGKSNEETYNANALNTCDLKLEILSAPSQAKFGENITINFKVTNVCDEKINTSIYSYVYSNLNCINEEGWTGNKINLELQPNQSVELKLYNKIKSDVQLGKYNLKVRALANSKKIDAISQIEILDCANSTFETLEKIEKVENLNTLESFNLGKNEIKVVWSSKSNINRVLLLFCTALSIFCAALLLTIFNKGLKKTNLNKINGKTD